MKITAQTEAVSSPPEEKWHWSQQWRQNTFRAGQKLKADWKKDLHNLGAGRKSRKPPTPFVGMKPNGKSQNISQFHGVLCLAKENNSILMWGHYCDRHRGIVIGFDSSNKIFTGRNGKGLRPVIYVKERVLFDATWKPNDQKLIAFEDQIVISKNSDWDYEQELRQIFQLASLKQKLLKDGSLGYFLPIPSLSIRSVTLGTKCSPAIERKVLSLLKRPDLSHVEFTRAFLDERKFALNFLTI